MPQTRSFRRLFLAGAALFLTLLPLTHAAAIKDPKDKDRKTPLILPYDIHEGEEESVLFSQLASQFRQHCLRVYIHAKSYEGKKPAVGDFGDDVTYERPTPVGGYWWDDRHVIIPDTGLQNQFINFIEIQAPGFDDFYPARIAGTFVKLQALLLEVLPKDDGDILLPHPLEFTDGDIEEASLLTYLWEDGAWRIKLGTGLGKSAITDDGDETIEFASQGVLVDLDGRALGLAFGSKALMGEGINYWQGGLLPYTPMWSREEADKSEAKLRNQLRDGVLECRFQMRIKVDDDEEENGDWSIDTEDDSTRQSSSEIRTPALVVGKRHLIAPLGLQSDGIAKIEAISVILPDGKEVAAEFIGAFRDYLAVVLEVKQNLPTDGLPAGFGLLDPFAAPGLKEKAAESSQPLMECLQRWQIDYSLGRRRELADHDRWLGTFRGFKGDTVVSTLTNEADGAIAFDTEGNLVAMAVTPRLMRSRDRNGLLGQGHADASAGFRPVAYLQKKFRADDAFDPALMPVDEDQGQRLIDLGVEFQPLDVNTARLFKASRETRGGRIGLLVTHVYPGSPADKLGIKSHDVLLRLLIEGKKEPMELRSSGFIPGGIDNGDLTSDAFNSYMAYMPPPWPNRENVISTILTGAGVGRKVRLDYLRDGEEKTADFVTDYFEPDYRCAKKEKFPELGLTVKPITFEVARFFGLPELSGVIVSKVEDGGKASVAGVHRYQLVTQVNGAKIADIQDFQARVEPFEKGEASGVELTVEGFGKTRLVKIE